MSAIPPTTTNRHAREALAARPRLRGHRRRLGLRQGSLMFEKVLCRSQGRAGLRHRLYTRRARPSARWCRQCGALRGEPLNAGCVYALKPNAARHPVAGSTGAARPFRVRRSAARRERCVGCGLTPQYERRGSSNARNAAHRLGFPPRIRRAGAGRAEIAAFCTTSSACSPDSRSRSRRGRHRSTRAVAAHRRASEEDACGVA